MHGRAWLYACCCTFTNWPMKRLRCLLIDWTKSSVPLPRRSFHRSTRSLTSLLRLMLRCLRQTPLCKKDYASIGPTQQSATAEARTQRFERTLNKETYERDREETSLR